MPEDVFGIVGTVVGGAFNVEAVVAEGGFAVVYRAYHGAFHAPVALKCLKVPTVARSYQRDFLERFREEGEVLFRLSQSIPAVVRPLHVDAFETAKGVFVPYMALEWLDGETLDVIVARRGREGRPPMSLKRAVRLLAPVARALARAHRFHGPDGPISIVHRDLKPDNIVVANVNGEEVVKILDFGIAKVKSVASQAAGRLSLDAGVAAVPFTPGYAAPEQWLPKRYGQTGPWTDVWGLALTTVETISGKPAIDGDHAAMMGTAIDEKRRPSPRSEGVTVPDEVENVFLRALEVDPRERYQDVGQFWDALERSVGVERSETPSTGYRPQPLRDPRNEGMPPALEEVIEAARDREERVVPSLRLAGQGPMPEAQKRAQTQDEEPAARAGVPGLASWAGAVPEVPDLDFGPAAPPAAKPPHDRPAPDQRPPAEGAAPVSPPQPGSPRHDVAEARADRATPQRAAESLPEPPSKPGMRAPDERVSAAGDRKSPPAAPPAEPAARPAQVLQVPTVPMADAAASSPGSAAMRSSGIDLAISPREVRRGSGPGMRTVGPGGASEGVSGGSALRSGGYRALGPGGKPIRAATSASSGRLGTPIGLTAVGAALAIAYYVNASMGGGWWQIGPIQVNWIAGLLVVAGMTMLLLRLFWKED
jgi:serine/threonine-protein kinase